MKLFKHIYLRGNLNVLENVIDEASVFEGLNIWCHVPHVNMNSFRYGTGQVPAHLISPAQFVAHILYYFSKQNDLVIDPMA